MLPFNINVDLSMPDLLPEISRTAIREATPEYSKSSVFSNIDTYKHNKDTATHNMVNTESIEDMNPFDKHLARNSGDEVSTTHQGLGGINFPWNIIGSFKSILSEIHIESIPVIN